MLRLYYWSIHSTRKMTYIEFKKFIHQYASKPEEERWVRRLLLRDHTFFKFVLSKCKTISRLKAKYG